MLAKHLYSPKYFDMTTVNFRECNSKNIHTRAEYKKSEKKYMQQKNVGYIKKPKSSNAKNAKLIEKSNNAKLIDKSNNA